MIIIIMIIHDHHNHDHHPSFPWLCHPPLFSFQHLPSAGCTHKPVAFCYPFEFKFKLNHIDNHHCRYQQDPPFWSALMSPDFTDLPFLPPARDYLGDPFLVSLLCLGGHIWISLTSQISERALHSIPRAVNICSAIQRGRWDKFTLFPLM